MKRTVAIIIAILSACSASAQQALWGGPQIVSPEINPDNSVTFRLKAPKAVKVQVTGDFLPNQKIEGPQGTFEIPGTAELTEREGIWEFTSAPLKSELYSYSFIVDGLTVRDPGNVYLSRDVSTITNIFIISGGRGDLYKVNDVPHGTVSRIWYDSQALGMDRRLTVYTPAGYEDSRRQYPVFYLLHGMGGDEEAWITLGRTAQILDNLIARGKAEPMIVVMTNGNAAQEAAPGESSAGFISPNMRLPKTMEGSFESSFPEIVNFIDKHFRTIRKKSSRAIAGLSMGGYHSLHISKQYPDMFDHVGLFSAAARNGDSSKSPVYQDFEQKLKIQFEKNPALYWIAIGNTDFLYEENTEFRKFLDEKGYKYTYYESEEGHIWKNWRIYLTEFAPLIFK